MPAAESIGYFNPIAVRGRVAQALGIVLEGYGPMTAVGELCTVTREDGSEPLLAEVVGFRGDRVLLMPLGDMAGIGPHSELTMTGEAPRVAVGPQLLGRILDGLGQPIDTGAPVIGSETSYPLHAAPPSPLARARITQPLDLGVRALNALLTCGRGQKIGIFASSGVGKSVLLGMISRYTRADVNVIALIGERGREVREFLDRDLGPEALRRSVVVVATSDQPPLVRIRGALLATAIAEYFRDQGRHVLLMMDSLSRLAYSQREIGLAVGEPPTTRGYPPSVFALLPKLLERVGTSVGPGSITGLYTVLVDPDDAADPIGETARSVLDGHIVLSRDLAARNHYPAIDLLQSASRVMRDVISPAHQAAARTIVDLTATYRQSEDLIAIGAYKPGADPRLDKAVAAHDRIEAFLRQDIDEQVEFAASVRSLIDLAEAVG